MASARKFSWMVSPKSLTSLIGAEHDLLRKAGLNVLIKFYIASVSILMISFVSVLSIVYIVELMFHSTIAELILSLLITGLFILMYVFLILTISNNINGRAVFSISNITRIGFVVFMAVMISKPIELYFFRLNVHEGLSKYKEHVKAEIVNKIKSRFSQDIFSLETKLQFYHSNNQNHVFDELITKLRGQINTFKEKEAQLVLAAYNEINRADYVIQQLRILHSFRPWTWGITSLLVILFLMPGYLIYSLSRDNTYYSLKEDYEKRIVSSEYQAFCKKYTEIFISKYGIERVFYTKYEDPPFNTKLEQPPEYKSAENFFERYS
jgi:hypothetical protein